MIPMNASNAAIDAFRHFVDDQDFPCVAAKSSLATGGMQIIVAGDLRDETSDERILHALRTGPLRSPEPPHLISTVVLFPRTPRLSERTFESHLWTFLQTLHAADRRAWDPAVSSDPQSPKFAMSIGGHAYFVVGLHPGSSRLSRRAPIAALAFNPHAQFRRLKEDGRYERLRQVVRDRDIVLQGNANPMLSEHGKASEAAQYSGRSVLAGWKCPFRPPSESPKCPR